jgi:hypothetical protein
VVGSTTGAYVVPSRILLAISAQKDWHIIQADAVLAFLNAKLQGHTVYMHHIRTDAANKLVFLVLLQRIRMVDAYRLYDLVALH